MTPGGGKRAIVYLFVDAGCLREQLDAMAKTYAAGHPFEVDYQHLMYRAPVTAPASVSKVFYYDALPGRQKEESDPDFDARRNASKLHLDRLHSLNGFHVYEGDVRRSNPRRGNEQKKIDVLITVDMLTHSFRKNMDEAILLTGDLDFKPLIDALVQDGM